MVQLWPASTASTWNATMRPKASRVSGTLRVMTDMMRGASHIEGFLEGSAELSYQKRIADPREIGDDRLHVHDVVVLHDHPVQVRCLERADKEVVFPVAEAVACVEVQV